MKTNQQIKIQDYLIISEKEMIEIIIYLKLKFFGYSAKNQLELQNLLISKDANAFFDSEISNIIEGYMNNNYKASAENFAEYAQEKLYYNQVPYPIVYNNTASISNITRHDFKNSYFLN